MHEDAFLTRSSLGFLVEEHQITVWNGCLAARTLLKNSVEGFWTLPLFAAARGGLAEEHHKR